MKKMNWLMSAAMVSVWAVGCGGQTSEVVVEETQAVAQELGPNKEFYGSDTLKDAIAEANRQSSAGLLVEGKGSSVGEGCLRNGSSPFCVGRQQTLAPMSREFKSTTSGCAGGVASGGAGRNAACCAGESSNIIALDAVNVWVKATNPTTNITQSDLKTLFCGPTGNGQSCAASTWTKYRRDDLSGTTDTFKSLVGCTAFCSDVVVIKDESATNPAPCTSADSATTCIGKLTANNANAIAYAGDSARYPAPPSAQLNKALSVNGVAPNATNVRKLLTGDDGSYPLSRTILLNENKNFTKTAEEQALYNWIYNTNKAGFETILKNQGFITCSTTGALACGGATGDGRGAGLCKGN